MTKTSAEDPSTYIVPLYMNGLQGRMLRLPAPVHAPREILLVYGHHSTLERWWGLAQEINTFGAVTMPDLPGFGGMQSFYKIHEKPTLDNYADYLAAFIKMRYARRRMTIVAMSFGFVVATRMLQRYPDLAKKVDMLVSTAGFSHYQDFKFSSRRLRGYRLLSRFLARPMVNAVFRNVALHPILIRTVYTRGPNAKHKFAHVSGQDRKDMVDYEVRLWHANDSRTHWETTIAMLYLNNCTGKHVDLPVWHIYAKGDQYFDRHITEQHLRVIFNDYHEAAADLKNHAPTVFRDASEAAALIPRKVREALAR